MFTDRQWSSAIANSVQVAILTTILATVLGTLAALGAGARPLPGPDGG